MIWRSATEFWAMGGYAPYVWGSMGVSFALLALEVWLTRQGRNQALDAVCEAWQSEPAQSLEKSAVRSGDRP